MNESYVSEDCKKKKTKKKTTSNFCRTTCFYWQNSPKVKVKHRQIRDQVGISKAINYISHFQPICNNVVLFDRCVVRVRESAVYLLLLFCKVEARF